MGSNNRSDSRRRLYPTSLLLFVFGTVFALRPGSAGRGPAPVGVFSGGDGGIDGRRAGEKY